MRIKLGKSVLTIIGLLLIGVGLAGCAGSGGNVVPVTTISAAEVQSLAADAGYLAYEFAPSANVVQPILAGVCSLDTTQDPILIASELQKILGQVWSGINSVNTPEGTIIVLLINNLVTELGLNTDLTSAMSNVSPYITAACVGVCQGIQAAENGTMPKGVKAELAAQGKLPIPMGLPPALVVQGNYTPANIGLWSKIKQALGL
ncbi:MAG: hypothetical protein P4L55_14210 [Syntrophobacteraceae bacterium]|nr:hypothetical protein [Syntrophobacteraceae bacterium]